MNLEITQTLRKITTKVKIIKGAKTTMNFHKIVSSMPMPRKPRFSRKKGKKQGTTPCSIQTNCSDISARTTQLTQASDRTTQITDIVPDSWAATPPKRSRSACTCNLPGSSVKHCPIHDVNADDRIDQDFGENYSIRTTTTNLTQISQMSVRTTQIPNTIPDSWPATSLQQSTPNCDQEPTIRCPIDDTIRGDRNRRDENNIPEGCICYEPGPAHQRCPLHEIEPANEIVNADPFNDSLNELLEAIHFNTPQENNLPDLADDIELLPPIPHQVEAANYLLAATRQNVEVHNCGHLDQNCLHCNAKFFMLERNSRGTYNKCCSGGNVFLAPFT
ncbi:hypothetical protein QE152_g40028 [Popillia japonica]|uniref:Uncharacterized protein n=1 Tax=Popillia japonica TaxID=7064 RepID=A0AAW1HSM5_POPJA